MLGVLWSICIGHSSLKDKIMKKLIQSLAFSAITLASLEVSALVIDTNPGWDGSVNSGWLGSGQSLTVDLTENVFDSIGFYFDTASWGRTFDFYVSDALNGGNILYSTAFTVTDGINLFNINQAMTPGSTIYALIDYRGFSGATAHFSYTDSYAGGNSSFGAVGSQVSYVGLDHRFIATFSDALSVSEPHTLALLSLGLVGIGLFSKRRKIRQ